MKRVAASNSTANATAFESLWLLDKYWGREAEQNIPPKTFLFFYTCDFRHRMLKRSLRRGMPHSLPLIGSWRTSGHAQRNPALRQIIPCSSFSMPCALPRQVNSCRRLSHELFAAALRFSPEAWGNVSTSTVRYFYVDSRANRLHPPPDDLPDAEPVRQQNKIYLNSQRPFI